MACQPLEQGDSPFADRSASDAAEEKVLADDALPPMPSPAGL
jgi:hypothetical protein